MYFENCRNESELKDRFRLLSKRFHPDVGGSDILMKELLEEYDKCKQKPPWIVKVQQKQKRKVFLGDEYETKIKSIFDWAECRSFFDTSFVESLQDQLHEKGSLSNAQEKAIDNIMKKFNIPIRDE